jgi:hypothetical protein
MRLQNQAKNRMLETLRNRVSGPFQLASEYSTAKRTRIPRESEHEFHGKTNADSTAKRTGFPRESEQ